MGSVKRPRVRGLSHNQARIIAQLRETPNTKIAMEKLGLSSTAIYMSNTRVYQAFSALLDAMIENYPVFKRRLEHDKTIYTRLRRLARMVNKGD